MFSQIKALVVGIYSQLRSIVMVFSHAFRKRDTLMFNGYAEEVARLYKGMDLTKFY